MDSKPSSRVKRVKKKKQKPFDHEKGDPILKGEGSYPLPPPRDNRNIHIRAG